MDFQSSDTTHGVLHIWRIEDQGDLFVANAKLDMKMTVIQSPLKYGTLAHSNFLQPFYYSARVTRIGEAGEAGQILVTVNVRISARALISYFIFWLGANTGMGV